MRIGLSLPLGYLMETPFNQDEQLLTGALGPPPAFLETLRLSGVSSIELGRVKIAPDPGTARRMAERVLDAGLGLTMHGYLPDPSAAGGFAALFPLLVPLKDLLREAEAGAVMVLHSYRGAPGEDAEAVKTRSAELLRRVASDLDREKVPLRVALEITRNHGHVDPSNTYQDLLDIRERVGREGIGFCWDIGHTHWNVLQGRLEPTAPVEFLWQVIHTHLHDLGPDGNTHWPLTEGCIPLGDYVGALRTVGYRGILNLELYPSRWAAVRDVRESIMASLDVLSGLLET